MSDSPRLCLGCNADLTGTYALRQRCVACVARRDRAGEAALKLTKRERHRRRFRAEPVICEVVAP